MKTMNPIPRRQGALVNVEGQKYWLLSLVTREDAEPQGWHLLPLNGGKYVLGYVPADAVIAPSLRTESGLSVPCVNLNGTSKQALLDEHYALHDALRTAIQKLGEVTIHGRDYHMQMTGEWSRANKWAEQAYTKLLKVQEDVAEITQAIEQQGT